MKNWIWIVLTILGVASLSLGWARDHAQMSAQIEEDKNFLTKVSDSLSDIPMPQTHNFFGANIPGDVKFTPEWKDIQKTKLYQDASTKSKVNVMTAWIKQTSEAYCKTTTYLSDNYSMQYKALQSSQEYSRLLEKQSELLAQESGELQTKLSRLSLESNNTANQTSVNLTSAMQNNAEAVNDLASKNEKIAFQMLISNGLKACEPNPRANFTSPVFTAPKNPYHDITVIHQNGSTTHETIYDNN